MQLKMNKDWKAHVVTVLAIVALIFAFLAVTTDDWFVINTKLHKGSLDTTENAMLKKLKSVQSFGLWRICTTVNFMSIHNKMCIKVSEGDKILEMANGIMHSVADPLGDNVNELNLGGYENDQSPNNNIGNPSDDNIPDDWLDSLNQESDFGNQGDIGDFNDFLNGRSKRALEKNTKYDYYSNDFAEEMEDGNDGDMSANIGHDDYAGDMSQELSTFKKMLYPDYLKAIQGLEIVAILTGVLLVILCVMNSAVYITYKSKMISVTMMIIIIGTGLIHMICIVLWVIEKEKEKQDPKHFLGQMDSALKENPTIDMKISYGWSWGMAIASFITYMASTIFLAVAILTKPYDEMEVKLTPQCNTDNNQYTPAPFNRGQNV